jgi:hypothetical protein
LLMLASAISSCSSRCATPRPKRNAAHIKCALARKISSHEKMLSQSCHVTSMVCTKGSLYTPMRDNCGQGCCNTCS